MSTPQIDSGQAISYGWTSVKKDFWYFIGLAVVVTVLESIGNQQGRYEHQSLLGFLLSIWMTCGYMTMVLSYRQGKKLPFSALFTNAKQYLNVLGATVLLGIIFALGLLLLIIPGIYFGLKYQFTITLIIDKNLGIGEAMRQSAALTNGRKMSLLGFDLICFGVILLGAICLGVGVFVAIPVVWLAGVTVYRQLGQSAPVPA